MYTNKEIQCSKKSTVEYDKIKKDPEYLREVYELDKCVQWINSKNAHNICLQFPDYLLIDSVDVGLYLENKLGHRVYVLGDTSYGSCCVDEVAAQHVNADAIIHFGHACLSPTNRIPVLYIFTKHNIDVKQFVSCFRETFLVTTCRVLLLYGVSYSHIIPDISKYLFSDYPYLVTSKLSIECSCSSTVNHMFGRCFNVAEGFKTSDYTVLFIGVDGPTFTNFVYTMPGTQFYIFNPDIHSSIQCYETKNSVFLRKRMYLIEKIKDAKTIGILIGTLGVTNYLGAVDRIKALTKKRGIKCYIIAVGKPNVAKLANFPEIEAFVLIACPENTLLDTKEFYQPIVTLFEVELAFNTEHTWSENYITDFRTLLPGGCNYVEEKLSETSEDGQLPEISLISGKLRQTTVTDLDDSNNESSSTLSVKSDMTVSHLVSAGGHFLSTRSWTGLEQNLGQTEVEQATVGRKGIPQMYSNEQHD